MVTSLQPYTFILFYTTSSGFLAYCFGIKGKIKPNCDIYHVVKIIARSSKADHSDLT